MTRKHLLLVVPILAATCTAFRASAQDLTAEGWFEAGHRAMEDGRTEEACEAFHKSFVLDPVPGAVLNVGDCMEKLGRRADAWSAFFEAEQLSVRDDDRRRAEYARDRRAALEASGPAVVIEVEAPVPPRMVVRHAGEEVPANRFGVPMAVDSGQQEWTVTAPGFLSWSTRTTFSPEAAVHHLWIPRLIATPEEISTQKTGERANLPGMDPDPREPGRSATPRPNTDASGEASWRKPAGAALVGLGAGFAAAGTYLVFRTRSLRSQYQTHCVAGDTLQCDESGIVLNDQAAHAQTMAVISLSSAAILVSSGTYLWLTADSRPASGGRTAASRVLVNARWIW